MSYATRSKGLPTYLSLASGGVPLPSRGFLNVLIFALIDLSYQPFLWGIGFGWIWHGGRGRGEREMVVWEQGDMSTCNENSINKKKTVTCVTQQTYWTIESIWAYITRYGKIVPMQILCMQLPLNAGMTITSYASKKMWQEVAHRAGYHMSSFAQPDQRLRQWRWTDSGNRWIFTHREQLEHGLKCW